VGAGAGRGRRGRRVGGGPPWALAVIGEGEDVELPVDGRGEREGIEAIAEGHEGGRLRVIDVGAREHALERRARGVVATAEAGARRVLCEGA